MNEDRIQHKGGCVSHRNTAPLTLFLYVDACHGRHRPTAITLHKQVDAGVRQTLWLCSAHAFDWLFRWCLFLLLCFSWHYKLVLMMCFGVLCWKVSPVLSWCKDNILRPLFASKSHFFKVGCSGAVEMSGAICFFILFSDNLWFFGDSTFIKM